MANLFKVNKKDTRMMYGAFFNFEHFSHVNLLYSNK